MKKLLFSLMVLSFAFYAQANSADLFEMDETALQNEFEDLNKLEAFLVENQDYTLENLLENNLNLTSELGLNENTITIVNQSMIDPLLGLSPFWFGFGVGTIGCVTGYGCFLGPLAVLYVYWQTDDTDAAKESAWGCVAGFVLGGAIYYFLVSPFIPSPI